MCMGGRIMHLTKHNYSSPSHVYNYIENQTSEYTARSITCNSVYRQLNS